MKAIVAACVCMLVLASNIFVLDDKTISIKEIVNDMGEATNYIDSVKTNINDEGLMAEVLHKTELLARYSKYSVDYRYTNGSHNPPTVWVKCQSDAKLSDNTTTFNVSQEENCFVVNDTVISFG